MRNRSFIPGLGHKEKKIVKLCSVWSGPLLPKSVQSAGKSDVYPFKKPECFCEVSSCSARTWWLKENGTGCPGCCLQQTMVKYTMRIGLRRVRKSDGKCTITISVATERNTTWNCITDYTPGSHGPFLQCFFSLLIIPIGNSTDVVFKIMYFHQPDSSFTLIFTVFRGFTRAGFAMVFDAFFYFLFFFCNCSKNVIVFLFFFLQININTA